jgi:hypothetical protein
VAVNRTRTAPDADDYLDTEEEVISTRTRTAVKDREDDDALFDEDDEDEIPERSSLIQKGWGAAKKAMSESSNLTNDFRFGDEPTLVKFLSNEPFTFKQHFLEKKSGKKSYVCIGKDCPLCRNLGDTPSNKFAFPIVNLDAEGYPTQLLVAGPRLCGMLEKLDADKRQGPLEKNYYTLARSGKGSSTSYSVQLVKARDLAEDFDLDHEDVEEFLTTVKAVGPEAIYVNSKQELLDIAHDLSD